MVEDKRYKLKESNINKLNPYKETTEKFFPKWRKEKYRRKKEQERKIML